MNFKKIKSVIFSGMLAATSVAGTFSAVAPSLNAAAANDDYARLLQYSLYFFDANMCGDDVQSKSAISWRSNCHTDDAVPGGYHDAGDHVMFGLPQGFAASTLGWSYYEFKDAYTSSGQAEHLKLITDRFCDFFKRSAKMNGGTISEFLYQKGSGVEDHNYWGPPEKQGGGRRMYWTNSTGGDIAAEYAAALAVNYINFGNAEDLTYAKAYYDYSLAHGSVVTDGPSEGGQNFYKNGGAGDEQAWAAGWLYKATNDGKYKSKASEYNHYLGWVHGWESVDLGAACLNAEINNDWSEAAGYMNGQCTGSGYYCLDDWGSARLNTSMQFTALVATKHGAANLSSWAQGQMDYILGNNPFNTCFVTGFASNSAKNVHHRAASGYEGYNPPDGMNEYTTTYHPSKSHVLIGALTGGPNKAGQYSDVMNDYQCNEVAIDYQACLVGAAAGLCSMYDKNGTTASSIEGVTKIYSGGGNVDPPQETTTAPQVTTAPPTDPGQTVTTTPPSTSGDVTLLPSDMKVGTEKGDDGEINNYAEFSPKGAKSATLYLTVKSNDTEVSGGFGTWTGTWDQENFEGVKVGADKTVAIDYTIPSNVGSTVKAMVFWPHGDNVVIDKIVLHSGSSSTPAQTTKTTTKTTSKTTTKTTTPPTSSGNGYVEKNLNQSVDYTALPKDDKMIGWEWADLGVTAKDTITKVEVNISANGNIGKWQGAFGSSTKVSPDYWTQTEDMEQTFNGNKGTITWNISSADAEIIQTQYKGELKLGIWWIDCQQFTIDSIKVYTESGASVQTTTKTAPTTTKTAPTTTTPPATNPPASNVTLYGDANCDGKVSIADATAILQHLGNEDKYGLKTQGKANADVDGSSGITGNDAVVIQKVDAGMIKASDLPLK